MSADPALGYGGARISESAAATARVMLYDPPAVVPRSNGGIQLEWHRDAVDVEIEIGPDGKLTDVAALRVSPPVESAPSEPLTDTLLAAEREACAALCEAMIYRVGLLNSEAEADVAQLCADRIRARAALRSPSVPSPDCPDCGGAGGFGPGGFDSYTGEWQGEKCERCGGNGKDLTTAALRTPTAPTPAITDEMIYAADLAVAHSGACGMMSRKDRHELLRAILREGLRASPTAGATDAVAAEREACAEVCNQIAHLFGDFQEHNPSSEFRVGIECRNAIRARSAVASPAGSPTPTGGPIVCEGFTPSDYIAWACGNCGRDAEAHRPTQTTDAESIARENCARIHPARMASATPWPCDACVELAKHICAPSGDAGPPVQTDAPAQQEETQ